MQGIFTGLQGGYRLALRKSPALKEITIQNVHSGQVGGAVTQPQGNGVGWESQRSGGHAF